MMKAYMMNAKRNAIPLLKKYLQSKGYTDIPKKENELYRIYCAIENINPKGKKLRDILLDEFRNGKLNTYKSIELKEKQQPAKKYTKKKQPSKTSLKAVENIYQSTRWADIKRTVYYLYEFRCMKCGTKEKEMHVDHICPVSKYPAMKWSINNMQLLCRDCNMEKSNLNEIDYRTLEQKEHCTKYMNGEI